MRLWVKTLLFLSFLAGAAALPVQPVFSEDCEEAVQQLNRYVHPQIDEVELVTILRALNESGNKSLPPKFVTKRRARQLGWKPGRDLWEVKNLKGKSLGGDVFSNRERRLPNGKKVWHEADLDYRGGRRGPKRIVYSEGGLRAVTVDHYQTFQEVPPCR